MLVGIFCELPGGDKSAIVNRGWATNEKVQVGKKV
jgi:hypothetical protein